MRLSCCAYSFRHSLQSGSLSLPHFIDKCAAMGFDGVELTSYYFRSTDRTHLNALKRRAHAAGIAISGTAIGTNFTQPDPMLRAGQVKMCKDWIEHSVVLGAPTLRVFAGYVANGQDSEEALHNVVTSLTECGRYAWEQGVTLVLENHGGITGTAEDTLQILRRVNLRGVRLNLDLGNFCGDVYAQFKACARKALAVHAKPSFLQEAGKPEARTELDYRRIREILDDASYRGFIAIEYEEENDPEEAVPAFAAQIRAAWTD
jgi:sugar phosphate isomerase/epimerase